MGDKTGIEWTDATWNPVVGCSIVSPGCTNCYAMKMAGRLEAMGSAIYKGHTIKTKAGFVWNGKVSESNWGQMIRPLSLKKPRRIFVNSMSDLFHENLPDGAIDKVFAVMALCPQHTFQVLTKRPKRMQHYMAHLGNRDDLIADHALRLSGWPKNAAPDRTKERRDAVMRLVRNPTEWHGLWLGVSVEDQARADERIPLLLETPAAKRFLSCEPLLGPLNIARWLRIDWQCSRCRGYFTGRHKPTCPQCGADGGWSGSHAFNGRGVPTHPAVPPQHGRGVDLVIIGGESGPNSRPFNVSWARSIIEQCDGTGAARFVKQLGRRPYWDLLNGCGKWPTLTRINLDGKQVDAITLKDKKGGDMAEWAEDLRVREMPE